MSEVFSGFEVFSEFVSLYLDRGLIPIVTGLLVKTVSKVNMVGLVVL